MDLNVNPFYKFEYKYAILDKQLKQVHANFGQSQLVSWCLRFYLEKFNSCVLLIIVLSKCTYALLLLVLRGSFLNTPQWALFMALTVSCKEKQWTSREATAQMSDVFLQKLLNLFKTIKPIGFNYHGQQEGVLNLHTSASPEHICVFLL